MLILKADGGCNPNPGEGRIGVVAYEDGRIVWQLSRPIGPATNNIAEWKAALAALHYVYGFPFAGMDRRVELRMDSQLVILQLTGQWRTKNAGLKPLMAEGQQLMAELRAKGCPVQVRWVPRAENTDADALT